MNIFVFFFFISYIYNNFRESKEEKGASDADMLRKKQIRSTMAVTATAQKMANSDLSQSAISVKVL